MYIIAIYILYGGILIVYESHYRTFVNNNTVLHLAIFDEPKMCGSLNIIILS